MVRNPLDSIASWWHLGHSRGADGKLNHEAKLELPGGKFGALQRTDMIHLARRWRDHAYYWQNSPILLLEMRYEDFRVNPVPNVR